MIRLVFISTLAYNYFFPARVHQAGGHTRIYNLSRAFARLPEYDVFCVTGDFGQPERVKKNGVTLVKAPIDKPFAALEIFLKLRRLKPDIIIDFCASPRLFLYYMLQKMAGIKYLFLTGCDNDVNGNYQSVENFIYAGFYMWGLRHADGVIAQVPYHKKVLSQKYGIDSYLVLSPYFEIKKKKPGKKNTVLWVGRAAYYKRPDLFVALSTLFPNQKFIMICNKSDYDRGFMDMIQKNADALSNLEFHDYIPYPEMNEFYRHARLLVNTSDFEGFPNTFIEAAVHSTPVLSLNSDPNRMLSFYRCGYTCHGSFNLMKEYLASMLSDDNLVTDQGQRIFDYACRFHKIEHAVGSMDKIFKSMLCIK